MVDVNGPPSRRDDLVAEALELGAARFPCVRVSTSAFREFLGTLTTDNERLRRHAEDVYLAFACASGTPGAAEALEQTQLVHVPQYVRRYGTARDFVDEVMQRLRWRLLLDHPPKIASYSGAGPLGAWIRITAVRVAIDRASAQDRAVPLDSDARLSELVGGTDPELEALRRRYGPGLQQALRAAVDALSPENRTLLWLHYGQRLNIDRLGSIYGTHRATVARWLAVLRRDLFADVRERFRAMWHVSDSEFRSLYRAIEPDLRISLRQLHTSMSDEELAEFLDADCRPAIRSGGGH